MIETAEASKTCPRPKCGGVAVKAGKRADGLQRYRCTSCGKTFSDRKEQKNVFGTKQVVKIYKHPTTEEQRGQAFLSDSQCLELKTILIIAIGSSVVTDKARKWMSRGDE